MLKRLARIHYSFFRKINVTPEVAFLDFNLAPLVLRRDIGILGFLHKRVLGLSHPGVEALLPMREAHWHDKQIESFLDRVISRQPLYFRSLWGLVHVYNRLPQVFVDIDNVTTFQKELTHLARCRCRNDDSRWPHSFHSSSEIWTTRRQIG